MSKVEMLLAALAVTLVIGLIYGVLIYNHKLNVDRDKFLIERCYAVNAKRTSVFSEGIDYTCVEPDTAQESEQQ